MAEFKTQTFLCRANRAAKLYQNPYDTTPSTMIIPDQAKFISTKQYYSSTIDLYYITEKGATEPVPVGYWCPANIVDSMYIDDKSDAESVHEDTEDDSVAIDETLTVKAKFPNVYATYTDTTPIPNGLAVGDKIICDRKISVNINGTIETRYHISEVIGDDTSLVGAWVTYDKAIRVPDGPKIILNNTKVEPVRMRSAAAPMMYAAQGRAAVAAADVGGGGGSVALTPDGGTITLPPATITSTPETGDSATTAIDPTQYADLQKLFEEYGFDYTDASDTSLMGVPLGRMTFVHGMPFQYTPITDRRNGASGMYGEPSGERVDGKVKSGAEDMYGRSFAREIAANMPIVAIAPGTPKFLSNVEDSLVSSITNGAAQKAFIPVFQSDSDKELSSAIESISDITGEYNYYSMNIDTEKYFEYVNSLCQTSAKVMGLANVKLRGTPCPNFDWKTYNTSAEQDYSIFQKVIGLDKGVSFAFDPQSSLSDTMTNQTTESMFASMFNEPAKKARELEFILGETGTGWNEMIDSANYEQVVTDKLEGGAFAGARNAITRITGWLNNTIHGMNIRFPELWGESSHTPSYELDMHFITPYANAFCEWRYVLVPFFHIFALAAPRSDKSVTQYQSPFLIRAFSKSYFNVEMGIIDSLTWKRFGDGDMIGENGIPTQIDVTVSFKDLYHTLAMTNMFGEGGFKAFFNNSGLLDLVGTLSGVNMNRLTLLERASIFMNNTFNEFGSMGGNFMRSISDRIRNIAVSTGLYGL